MTKEVEFKIDATQLSIKIQGSLISVIFENHLKLEWQVASLAHLKPLTISE